MRRPTSTGSSASTPRSSTWPPPPRRRASRFAAPASSGVYEGGAMLNEIQAQLPHTLSETDFPALGSRFQGKVRDTYRRGDRLILVTTDRLSAFDRVLTTIPFKGEVLNRLSAFWF